MINTIFWFADSKSQYDQELATQGVSDKTIVFIKDTGEIYVNNKKYGNTLQDILNDPELSSMFSNSALKQQVQNMIDVLENKHDTDIATLTGTVNTNRNTQISDKDELNRKINDAKSEWNTILNNTKTEINNKIDTAESDAATARQNIIDNVNSSISDMNATISSATTTATQAAQRAQDIYDSIDSTVSSAVQDAIEEADLDGSFGQINTKLTTLENGLSATTTRVDQFADDNGDLKAEVYQSIIDTIIDDDSALTEIGSRVAVTGQLTEGQVDVVEWWASQVSTYASQNNTFAQMVAAVSDGVDSAYVISKINESLDGYVALSELNTKIQECQAFVNVKSTADTASTNVLAVQGSLESLGSDISSIESDIDQLETNQTGFNTTIAGLTSRVTDQEAKTSFIANYNADSGAVFNLTASEAESLMNSIVQHENAVATIQSVTTTDSSGVDINAIVEGKLETALSGYATQSWVDNDSNVASAVTNITNAIKNSNDELISSADILTKANTNESNISALSTTVSGHTTSIAGLQTSTSNNASAISSLTSRVATTESDITTINNAGFISSANVDTAVAGLFASNSSSNTKSAVEANIIATVNDGLSNITLSADKIDFTTTSASFSGAVQAVDITASALAIKNSDNETTAYMNSDGSWGLGSDAIKWTPTESSPLSLSQNFLQALTGALENGVTNNSTVQGHNATIYVTGSICPVKVTLGVSDIERVCATPDASKIYYYDSSTNPHTTGGFQYPLELDESAKHAWFYQNIYGYKLKFSSGILQSVVTTDIYTGKPISQLTESEMDSRVDVIYKLTDAQISQLTGLRESRYKGDFFIEKSNTNAIVFQAFTYTSEELGTVDGSDSDDWLLVGEGVDPITIKYNAYTWDSTNNNWVVNNRILATGSNSIELYRHTNP